MDFQIIGLIFASVGVAASIVWFVLLRRGVRSLEKGSRALGEIRDHFARQSDKKES